MARAILASVMASLVAVTGPAAFAQSRAVVDASAPEDLAVSVYRDPNRRAGQDMNRDWPRGFAMISETRQVTLPAGRSTIRFAGVAEGMVAVSAIVTGLPGGTIEKNRNADLLSPASLIDGTLGNRVSITRTNPATGVAQSEDAIFRTRADGGLVLQTQSGFEAVRCSGLPEKLTFDALPDGLSSGPVFSIDTRDDTGGTYEVTLTYLSWGFDWQANYVATLKDGAKGGKGGDDVRMNLTSWLTVLNDNGQSFEGAELMAIAGKLNVVSDFQSLANPPAARPLRLTCYPLGSALAGSPIPDYSSGPPPGVPMLMEGNIVVTARRAQMDMMSAPMPVSALAGREMAVEEDLGDLKLYRVPMPVDVNAQGLKQVAFLREDNVKGRFLYTADCSRWGRGLRSTAILFATVNDKKHGLGAALPTGNIAFFEPSSVGDLLTGEQTLRDYAEGQDVEIALSESAQVMAKCERLSDFDASRNPERWSEIRITLTNANPAPVTVRVNMGPPSQWAVKGIKTTLKNGQRVAEVKIPANGQKTANWQVRSALAK